MNHAVNGNERPHLKKGATFIGVEQYAVPVAEQTAPSEVMVVTYEVTERSKRPQCRTMKLLQNLRQHQNVQEAACAKDSGYEKTDCDERRASSSTATERSANRSQRPASHTQILSQRKPSSWKSQK